MHLIYVFRITPHRDLAGLKMNFDDQSGYSMETLISSFPKSPIMAVPPARKRRRLSPSDHSSSKPTASTNIHVQSASPLAVDSFLVNASRWNLEQDYESKPRKLKKKGKENTRLPIKNADGRIEQLEVPVHEDDDNDSWLKSGEDENEDTEDPVYIQKPKVSDRQQIIDAKEELARIATLINEDPEEYSGGFKTLAQLAQSSNIMVKKLALATQMAVFKDVIPGYRIRPLGELDMTEKVSKEIRKLRMFEQGLVQSYQAYVKELGIHSRLGPGDSEKMASLATVAVSCACTLLLSVPHFNFRSELIKILAEKLGGRRIDKDYIQCRTTLETLFQDDEEGNASLDAVTNLTRMIKNRNYNIDESALNTLLHLRLLKEFSSKASQSTVDKPSSDTSLQMKMKKKQRVFRTKKQRKAAKELKIVEKDFREADAVVGHEERDRMQAETLKLVFATYFRILKARIPSLTGAVLEGLAKYAHLINQDFFGDLLEVLKEISSRALSSLSFPTGEDEANDDNSPQTKPSALPEIPFRTALLSTATAFALLSSQDASRLSLDLSAFTSHLYTLLIPLSQHPDLEFSHKTLRLADPHAVPTIAQLQPKVNVATLSTLLMRALAASINPRSTPPVRLAAFTHRIMMMALHTPERTSTAIVTLLQEISKSQGRKIAGLWSSEERRGDGEFDPLAAGFESGRPFCGTVWEGELLRLHYASGVSEGLKGLEGVLGGFLNGG